MANVIVNKEWLDNGLTDIADSIRAKTGEQGALAFPDGFVSAVDGIEQGGGGEITPSQALQFWAGVCYLGGNIRFDETIKTVGDLTFTRATELTNFFRDSSIEETGVITANEAKSINYFFNEASNLQRVGGVVAPKATNWASFFSVCRNLVEITNPLDISAATNVGEMFAHCNALKEVRFVEGSIRLSLTFQWSPLLSAASVQSIIDGLADLTDGTTQTLTLHADVAVSDEKKAEITLKNWTLVQ